MGLRDSKTDNAAAALVAAVIATGWVYLRLPDSIGAWKLSVGIPWWLRLPVALAIGVPPVWYVAWCWYCIGQRDMKRLAEWHKPKAKWCMTALRVIFTRETWKDVKATKRGMAQRRAAKGRAAELLAYVDDKRGGKKALALLQRWVRGAAPTGTGDAWVETALPRAVRRITETATGVELVVVMPAKAGSAKKVMEWAAGIESQAQAPKGSLTIRQLDGEPPHVTMWRFTLRAIGKVEPTTTAQDLDRGIRLGVNPHTAQEVRTPTREKHGLVAGASGSGKSYALRAAVQQYAASPTPCEIVVLDPPGGTPSFRSIPGVRYISGHDAARAYIAELTTINQDRDAIRESLNGGVGADRLTDDDVMKLLVVADEVPEMIESSETPKERRELLIAWRRVLYTARKNNIEIVWGTNKFTKDIFPPAILGAFHWVVALTLSRVDAMYLLGADWAEGHMDPSSLVTGTGHACVRTADSNSWQRVNLAPPADAPPRPLPPPSGMAATVHGLSTPTVHAPSTALSTADGQSIEQDEMGGWVERLSGDDESDDTRRVKILAVLGEVGRPLGLSAIEARTGVPRSTARRLVEAFVEDGLVVAEQGARNGFAYRLASGDE